MKLSNINFELLKSAHGMLDDAVLLLDAYEAGDKTPAEAAQVEEDLTAIYAAFYAIESK